MEPYHEMVITYYQHFDTLRALVPILIETITSHLRRISRFPRLISNPNRFAGELSFFRGCGFWDDILTEIDSLRSSRFFQGLFEFRERVIEGLRSDIGNLFRLFLIIKDYGEESLTSAFLRSLLKQIQDIPNLKPKLINLFNLYPGVLNKFLLCLPERDQGLFIRFLGGRVPDEESESLRNQLINLIQIQRESSHFFHLYFRRITDKYPDLLRTLDNPSGFDTFSQGILGRFHSRESYSERLEILGDYYDCELTKIGLMTLKLSPVVETSQHYTRSSDLYLKLLFEMIGEMLDSRMFIALKNRIAIYATGGHGRGEAFDDDYDLIVITDVEEPNLRYFANQVLGRMCRALTKRGVIPHFRFADYTRSYTVTLTELEDILNRNRVDCFIDQSQILGSRLIIGPVWIERAYDKLIEEAIFDRGAEYIRAMISEFHNRHQDNSELNIKEKRGGLRDIETLVLVGKVMVRIRVPGTLKVLDLLQDRLKGNSPDIRDDYLFLKRIRDIHRITTAARDEIEEVGLSRIGLILNQKSAELRAELELRMEKIYKEISEFLDKSLTIYEAR